jgi:CDGSH-type Zn-finger protein
LTRDIKREPGPIRVVGLSTTVMNKQHPRFSTSDFLLETALSHARETLGAETRLIKLNELSFRHCEGYYSKGADTCTWPCTITQQDPSDELLSVYESLVFWGDVVLVATPIRWGAPSSLYFKMIERMNCIQNQITVANRVLIRNKVASFIITGGQDNIQAVVGLMMMFFGELGFLFPQFPFIAHSRGWTAEDMEVNVAQVRASADLREGACALVGRCVTMAAELVRADQPVTSTERGGRKAHRISQSVYQGGRTKSEPVIADKKPTVMDLAAGSYWWCRCGKSKKQPFCDGAHKQGTDFTPLEFKLDQPKRVALCQCKHTATAPFCDGTHKKL